MTVESNGAIRIGDEAARHGYAGGDASIEHGAGIGKVVASPTTGEHPHLHDVETKRR